jgi:hypothetical protein
MITPEHLHKLRSTVYKGISKDDALALIDEVEKLRSAFQNMGCAKRGAFRHASFQRRLCETCSTREGLGL